VGVSGQFHISAALPLRKEPSVTVGWASRDNMGMVVKESKIVSLLEVKFRSLSL